LENNGSNAQDSGHPRFFLQYAHRPLPPFTGIAELSAIDRNVEICKIAPFNMACRLC
jgi:hypothetical protein